MDWIRSIDLKNLLLDKEGKEKIEVLQELTQQRTSYDLEKVNECIVKQIPHCQTLCEVGKDVFTDLEVLVPYKAEASGQTIAQHLCPTNLIGSKLYINETLTTPLSCIVHLRKRQGIFKRCLGIIESLKNQSEPDTYMLFQEMKKYENDVLWLVEGSSPEVASLYDMVYFTNIFLRKLNSSDISLTSLSIYRMAISPLMGFITPIAYVLVTYAVLRIKLGLSISFLKFIQLFGKMILSGTSIMGSTPLLTKISYLSYAFSIFFYFQGLFNSIEISKMVYNITKMLTTRMNNVIKYIQLGKQLHDLLWDDNITTYLYPDASVAIMSDSLDYFKSFSTTSFSICHNFGKQLKIFKYFKTIDYIPFFKRLYMIEAVHVFTDLVHSNRLCFTEYDESTDKPNINVRGFFHPCLSKDTIVANDLQIGGTQPNNMILTGPNAGGKSTVIKSTVICVLLSQTIGMSNALFCKMTPFTYINTQINIPDCKGKESLFEAEMYRSKHNLEKLKLRERGFSLIAMDEIFNSTNPIEGIAGAFAIARNMSKYKFNISIISTHYTYLTKLKKECEGSFTNYKMNVNINATTNEITFPYKLSKGTSRQYIALELLRKNNFDEDIIADALEIKAHLLK